MLSLTRYAGQRIIIGDDIIIQVSEIRRGRVQIDIQAPRDIPVHREEIYNRIRAERAEAEGDDLQPGTVVRFHPIIGGRHDQSLYRVRAVGDCPLHSRTGIMCAWLDGKPSCVDVRSLSRAPRGSVVL